MPPDLAVLLHGLACFSKIIASMPLWAAARAAAKPQPPLPTTAISVSNVHFFVSRSIATIRIRHLKDIFTRFFYWHDCICVTVSVISI
jgi:hypothetical protein